MKGILRTLTFAGIVAAGAVAAQPAHAQVRFAIGVGVPAPVYAPAYAEGYIPPCPGDGYIWTAGYYNAGIWIPGRWVRHDYYAARPYYGGRAYFHAYGRGFDGGRGRGFRR